MDLKNLALPSNLSVISASLLRPQWCSQPSSSDWEPWSKHLLFPGYLPKGISLGIYMAGDSTFGACVCSTQAQVLKQVAFLIAFTNKVALYMCISHPSLTCFPFILAAFNASFSITC